MVFQRVLGAARAHVLIGTKGRAALLAGTAAVAIAAVAGGAAFAQQASTTPTKKKPVAAASTKKPAAKTAAAPAGATVLPTVTVSEQRVGSGSDAATYAAGTTASATKTGAPLIETPQAVSVVTQRQIEDQGAQNVSQALGYTPGVLMQPNGESSVYDEAWIRGFTPIYYIDGLAVPLSQWWGTPKIETYGLDRIEVLKGPASVLYGQNAPGGLIDAVSKRPTEEPLHEVLFRTGSFARLEGAFDLSGPVTPDKTILYRLTGLVRDADTRVEHTKDQRLYIAPALTWKPSSDTTFTILANYGEDHSTYPHQYVPALGTLYDSPYGRISRSTYLGDSSFDHYDRTQYAVGYALEHRINEVFKFSQNLRFAGAEMDLAALRGEGLQNDGRTLNRSAFTMHASSDNFTVDNRLEAEFATGPLKHEAMVGLDYLHMKGAYELHFGAASSIDVYNPVYGNPNPNSFVTYADLRETQDQLGLYAQDRIKLDNWILTLGLRHDWASMETDNILYSTDTSQNDQATTGRAGLTYLFANGLAPYAAYSTSFQPVIGADINGNAFVPSTGQQVEIGVKYKPVGWDALFTLAAFDLTQQNRVTYDPNTYQGYQTGEVNVRGIELEAKAKVTKNIEFTASYAYLDSKVTESANPNEIGRPAPFAPDHQASAWLYYTFDQGTPFEGLRIGAGVRHMGETYGEVSSANPVKVPAYTLFDASLKYDFGVLGPQFKNLDLTVNATNLADKYYVTYCYGENYCSLGAGRTVLATLRYKW